MHVKSAHVFDYGGGHWCRYELELHCDYDVKHIYQAKAWDEYNTCYFSEAEGYVSFMVHNSRNEMGYNGHKFRLPIMQANGKLIEKEITGPWSSAASTMARMGFPQAVDVRFQGCIAGHILLSEAEKVLEQFKLPYHYRQHKSWEGAEPDPYTWTLVPGRKK